MYFLNRGSTEWLVAFAFCEVISSALARHVGLHLGFTPAASRQTVSVPPLLSYANAALPKTSSTHVARLHAVRALGER